MYILVWWKLNLCLIKLSTSIQYTLQNLHILYKIHPDVESKINQNSFEAPYENIYTIIVIVKVPVAQSER